MILSRIDKTGKVVKSVTYKERSPLSLLREALVAIKSDQDGRDMVVSKNGREIFRVVMIGGETMVEMRPEAIINLLHRAQRVRVLEDTLAKVERKLVE